MTHRYSFPSGRHLFAWLFTTLLAPACGAQSASVYYVCPGNVFTNTISQRQADERGCKARETSQPMIIAAPKPRSSPAPTPAASERSGDMKVDGAEQRARDSDARRILTAELRREEEQLEALRRAFNNGEPERRGEERNAQKYLDRVAEMKSALQRKEADVAAIRRELNKLPS